MVTGGLSIDGRVPRQACVVRHVAFEDLGTFGPLLAAHGFDLSMMDAGVDDLFEPVLRSDLVVVLGGPIGVYEEEQYPFLLDERRALEQRLREGLPTLGICLGAQLMAAALGARVYPGPQKEIGWAPVMLTPAGAASCLNKLEAQPVLHWHGDTFDLPSGAQRLASTSLYENQAFSLGPNILALQFHPELEARRFEQWLIGHAGELAAAGVDVAQFRATVRRGGDALRSAATSLLGHWLEGLRW
ncbi:MAG TPA: glutamine amidotransferase [Polyangiaceae bacterium]|nr:glutamine amidotransferase [Polyangiaceae bacterium]